MLQSSVSNLQRLFSKASSSAPPHKLESWIEEAHTYDLLFPEGVRHGDPAPTTAAASSCDDTGGVNINSPRDVRIVIAQDATARSPLQKTVLYDSHPPSTSVAQTWNGTSPEAASRRHRAGSFGGLTGGRLRSNDSQMPRTAPHSRQSSFSQIVQPGITSPISPLSPVREVGVLFGNSEGQTSSARPATRDGETEALLDCMFGAYSGLASTSGTKLHIRPPKSTPNIHENRPGAAARNSTSPATFPKARTRLTRSTTASELQKEWIDGVQHTPRSDSCAIWITRLFTVDLKDPTFATHNPDESSLLEQIRSREPKSPEPRVISSKSTKKDKAKQLKTPMYAIAMVLNMPSHRQRPPTPSFHRSCGYSTDSSQSWPLDGSSNSSVPGLESSRDVEYVIAHRSVIDRALSELEIVALSKTRDALGKVDVPDPGLPRTDSIQNSDSGSNIVVAKPKQPTQRTLQLPTGALQGSPLIHGMADRIGKRIVLALKIRKVVTGQDRWDIWRHEMRWVDKWANGRECNFFFFNLLTAYLSYHTDWLQTLAPTQYRRRHAQQEKDGPKENNRIQNRIVIVSSDKMGSRRLVFLLSAFLPGSHFNLVSDGSIQSDSPNFAFSESPRSSGQIGRQQILGKAMSRRTRGNPLYEKITLHGRSTSVSDSDTRSSTGTPTEGQNTPQSSRRASDAQSVRSVALLITSDGSVTRKSSTTTTATIKAESAVPVAHFASHLNDPLLDGAEGPRPSSGESLAPVALQRTLSRSDSNEHSAASTDSHPGSVWGSVSKLWSSRRGSSTEASIDPLTSSEEGLGISGLPKAIGGQRMPPRLNQMVEELEKAKVQCSPRDLTDRRTAGQPIFGSSQGLDSASEGSSSLNQTHKTPGVEPLPLKLSIDEHDGIVDVDFPQPGSYPSSFGSMSSPIAVKTAASSLNDRSSFNCSAPNAVPRHSRSDCNVAGWLRNYHPDFVLSAVRPYHSLREQIKLSMRLEPTPSPASDNVDSVDKWTDVCSTIIADTAKCTVTRLCLRRKNAASPKHRANALLDPTRDVSHEEQIIEEPLMDMDTDATLIAAIEKIISHSGDSSRVASRMASRAASPSRRRDHNPPEISLGLEVPHSEVQKTVLGALQQIARSVSAEMAAQEPGGKAVGRVDSRYDGFPTESTLREGVRRWFREVDSHAT